MGDTTEPRITPLLRNLGNEKWSSTTATIEQCDSKLDIKLLGRKEAIRKLYGGRNFVPVSMKCF